MQFNPVEENLLATGSADRNVVLHDMRYLHSRLHCMQAHKEEVFQARSHYSSSMSLRCSSSMPRVSGVYSP